MNNEARQLAADSWNTVKAEDEPEYSSLRLSNDFRHSLNDAALAAIRGENRSGIVALEKFEDEVHRRLKDRTSSPVVVVPTEPADNSNLDSLTVSQLRELAKERGIEVSARAKKAELIEALKGE